MLKLRSHVPCPNEFISLAKGFASLVGAMIMVLMTLPSCTQSAERQFASPALLATTPNTGQNQLDLQRADQFARQSNFVEANRIWQRLADAGNANAQINLGLAYVWGNGVTRNNVEAVRLMRLAAQQEHPTAQANLALFYRDGIIEPRDYAEAFRLAQKAAASGQAFPQWVLGSMYRHGIGVERNDVTAVVYYRLSADQGHPMGLNNLGDAYEKGYGVQKNYAEAMRLYLMAIEKGSVIAMLGMGDIYAQGLGVPRNRITAAMWFRLATLYGRGRDVERARSRGDLLAQEMSARDTDHAHAWAEQCHRSSIRSCGSFVFRANQTPSVVRPAAPSSRDLSQQLPFYE